MIWHWQSSTNKYGMEVDQLSSQPLYTFLYNSSTMELCEQMRRDIDDLDTREKRGNHLLNYGVVWASEEGYWWFGHNRKRGNHFSLSSACEVFLIMTDVISALKRTFATFGRYEVSHISGENISVTVCQLHAIAFSLNEKDSLPEGASFNILKRHFLCSCDGFVSVFKLQTTIKFL